MKDRFCDVLPTTSSFSFHETSSHCCCMIESEGNGLESVISELVKERSHLSNQEKFDFLRLLISTNENRDGHFLTFSPGCHLVSLASFPGLLVHTYEPPSVLLFHPIFRNEMGLLFWPGADVELFLMFSCTQVILGSSLSHPSRQPQSSVSAVSISLRRLLLYLQDIEVLLTELYPYLFINCVPFGCWTCCACS